MDEVTIVKAHQLKSDGTLAVVIPKMCRTQLKIEKGTRLMAFIDSKNRLIFQPVE